MRALRWYGNLLEKKPLSTKTITSVFTLGLGDLLCQSFENNKQYDWNRTLKQASLAFLITPYLHVTYSKIMPTLFPTTDKLYLLKSILYDQTLTAILINFTFFTYLDMLSGKTWEQTKDELKVKFIPTLIDNWKVWPACMLINFYFVPIPWRVLYVNFIALFWNAYLSYIQNVKSKIMIKNKI
jgi:protein Mpv17